MKCVYCGHRIHINELEKTVYTDHENDRYAVRWTCYVCRKKGQTIFCLGSLGIDKWTNPEDVHKRFCDKYFVHDAINPQEMIEIEHKPPILSDEVEEVKKQLRYHNPLELLRNM